MKTVDNFQLVKPIGRGAYGTVYLCSLRTKDKIEKETKKRMRMGRKVACKMIPQKRIKAKIKKYLVQEIEIMMKLKHENILRFLEAKKTSNNIYIFVEFCNGGDLRQLMDAKGGQLDEKLVKIVMKQVAEGIKHLHDQKSMHRDLKLDNIMIHFPGYDKESGPETVTTSYLKEFDCQKSPIEVVIGDLGFARSFKATDMIQSYCGTPLNMAPEIMQGKYYDTKVDIWSFGTMMYELLVGFTPFTGMDPHDLANNVDKGDYGIPKDVKLSLQCLDVLHKCLQFDQKKRISHEDLVNHPFFIEDSDSEKINLSVSTGGEQNSFFNKPMNVLDLNEDNAFLFNVKDSILFNQTYQKALIKFQQKQAEVQKEPEEDEDSKEPENDEGDNLSEAGSQDDMSDYKSILQESQDPRMSLNIIQEEDENNQSKAEESKGIELNANQEVEVMKTSQKQKQEVVPKEEEPKKEEVDQPKSKPDLVEKLTKEPIDEKPKISNQNEEFSEKKVEKEAKIPDKKPEEDLKVEIDDDEDAEDLDFTVIDFNKELLRAKEKLNPIIEQPSELEDSTAKSTLERASKKEEKEVKKEEKEVIKEEPEEIEDFEIVHFHEIQATGNEYLIGAQE